MEIRYSRSLPTYVKVRSGIVHSRKDSATAGASLYYGDNLHRIALAFETCPGYDPNLQVLRVMMDLNEDEYEELRSRWNEITLIQPMA